MCEEEDSVGKNSYVGPVAWGRPNSETEAGVSISIMFLIVLRGPEGLVDTQYVSKSLQKINNHICSLSTEYPTPILGSPT